MKFIILMILNFFAVNSLACVERSCEAKRIVIILSPSDGELWSDKMIDGFSSELFTTKLKFSRYIIGWSYDETDERILNDVKQAKPDLVFFPSSHLYKRFSKLIPEKTDAEVMFTSCVFDKSELENLPIDNDLGVYSIHPVKYLMEEAKKVKQIESVGIVSGTVGADGSENIVKALKGIVDVELVVTDSVDVYRKKTQQFARKHDAVMPIAPLGIKDSQGNWVAPEQMGSIIEEINEITLGYGRISGVERTIELNIDPKSIGRAAAYASYDYFSSGKKRVKVKESQGLRISQKSIQKLNLTVPDHLKKYVHP